MDRLDAVVTGATGLIGRWLVPLLTGRGRNVGVLVRDAAARAAEYRAWVSTHGGDASRVRFFEADLAEPGLGLDDEAREALRSAQDFFHLGAAMQFGLDLAHARKVNVDGTRQLLELARSAPQLRRVVHVGGFKAGEACEHGSIDTTRLGAYELTKLEADALVREMEGAGLPVTRVQPGAIIGDARTGETTQFWGFSDLVRDLYRGKLPAVVGGEGFWMPLVTVDHLAAFIAGVPELAEPESCYVVLDDATPSLEELLERVARHLGVMPVRRAVPKGALEVFLRMGGERLTGVSPEAVSFVDDERYDVAPMRKAMRDMGLEMPDLERAVSRSVDFFVATRFGARTGTSVPSRARARASGMRRVAGVPTYVEGDIDASDMVFLHGIPLDASSWDPVIEILDRPGAARADLPGMGRTTKIAAPLAWMESLLAGNTRRPWIVAHSLGTRYAVEWAARHPERASGLVLVSPFFLQAPPPFLMRNAVTGTLAMTLMRESDLAKLVGEAWIDAPREHLSRPGARARTARALADAHAVRDELATALRSLAIPVVILAGEHDPLVADPGPARVVTIAGAGHYPQLHTAGAVASAIGRYAQPRMSVGPLRAAPLPNARSRTSPTERLSTSSSAI
ncbi:MAG: alpha/beta fold hydrolase [Labilithrix sp.]|nr:alpha/beta fold hydrolase [Labilithrix sp.]